MKAQRFIENFLMATDFQKPVEVTLDSEIRNLPEWDSLAALGVIVMFNTEYNQVIDGNHIHNAVTVNDLFLLLA